MKLNLLSKYILKKSIKTFFVIFFSINGILYTIKFTKISNRLFNMSFFEITNIVNLLSPIFIFETMFYVLIVSIFLSIYQFFSSNELTIFKVMGYNYKDLMLPFAILTALSFLISVLSQILFPYSIKKHIEQKAIYSSANLIGFLKKNTFNDIANKTIIFKNIKNNNTIKDLILINKSKDSDEVIFSEEAKIGINSKNEIFVQFENSKFLKFNKIENKFYFSENDSGELILNTFGKDDISIDADNFLAQYSLVELYKECSLENKNCLEFHKRIINSLQLIFVGLFISITLLTKNNSRVDRLFFDHRAIFVLIFSIILTNFILPILVKRNLLYLIYGIYILSPMLFTIRLFNNSKT